MQDDRILNILKSPNATLAVLLLALIAQTPHAADVFRLIVRGEGLLASLHSYSFAIALELAVFLFVVRNKRRESYIFAGVSIAMNLSYYHLHKVNLLSISVLPALLVSIALPVAIALYSHAVANDKDLREEIALQEEITQSMMEKSMQDAIAQSLQDASNKIQEETAQLDLQERVQSLLSENLDAKWIATHELLEVAGNQLASLLGVNASTISRWRKEVQKNGHTQEA